MSDLTPEYSPEEFERRDRQNAINRIVELAKYAEVDGVFLIRGASATGVVLTFDGESLQTLQLATPHELLVVLRFPAGDGGEAGIESR